jgi:hypothetical protein
MRWLVLAGSEHAATIFLSAGCALWYAPDMPADAGRASSKEAALQEISDHLGIPPATKKK